MISRRALAALPLVLPFIATEVVAAPPVPLKPFPLNSPVGDIAIRGKDVFRFDGKTWDKWCPCMDEGGTYCAWGKR